MGKKRPTNENIHIGNIFKETFRDECGSDCAFYQVVRKRAKTRAELRSIRGEHSVDENCNPGLGQVWAHPLPGQFLEDAEIMTVGGCMPSDIDGRNWLHGRGEDGMSKVELYREILPGIPDRTRQRDFQELEKLGYSASYSREWPDEPGRWRYEIPGAHGLKTIPPMKS